MDRLSLGKLGLDHDRDYGSAHRSGWSVSWDGIYLVELWPSLSGALLKASFVLRQILSDPTAR